MSGFEIAGIVLGSIPLIIEALKQYSDALATIDNMKNYEHAFKTLLADFVGATSFFYDNWESILISDLPVEQVNKLLKTRTKDLWADENVQDLLRRKLGRSSQTYIDMSANVNDGFQKLAKRLKLDAEDFRPRWISKDGDVDLRLRKKLLTGRFAQIRGGINIDKLQKEVQSLKQNLYFLELFQANAMAIEPRRIEKRHQAATNCWGKLSERAKWLFECLNSQFYQCGCRCVHQADLELRVPGPALDFEWKKEPIIFEFSVSDPVPACNSMPWSWREIEIEAEENILNSAIELASKPGGVSFLLTESSTASPTDLPRAPPQIKLNDLCKALAVIQPPTDKSYLGFLETQQWKHHVYCSRTIKQNVHSDVYSLEGLLYSIRVGNAWRSGVFTPRERALLAVNMSHAVLQFHNTAWLQDDWSIKDVFVRQENTKAPQITTVYLSRKFNCVATTLTRRTRPWIRNEMIYSLGLAILEIIYCQSISQLVKEAAQCSGYNINDPITEYIVAGRLANELSLTRRGMVSDGFADVARICVWCDFGDPTNDLSDSKFRQKFYAMVVEPLAEEYRRTARGFV